MQRRIDRPNRSGQAGFTLTEILVVLAILSISLIFVMPNFRAMGQRARHEGFMRKMTALASQARFQAVSKSNPVGVVVDTQANSASIYIDEDFDGWDATDPTGGVMILPTGLTFSSPAGPAVDLLGSTATTHWIQWLGDGSIDVDPLNLPVNDLVIRVGDGGPNYVQMRFYPISTGKTVLEKWNGSAWKAQDEDGVAWQWD